MDKSIAVMQPYLFPYLGYFQLIQAVDKFIFYDDVNYIKNGWINRNQIIINRTPHYFTVKVKGASSYIPINEIEIIDNRPKLKKTIQMAYCKAPQFEFVWPLLEICFELNSNKINEITIFSIVKICEYLNINTKFEKSSQMHSDSKGLEKTERLIEICKAHSSNTYINSIGGRNLYNKDDFKKWNIDLFFLQPILKEYKQFSSIFIPGLSIIDVLMFNSKENIKELISNYNIV